MSFNGSGTFVINSAGNPVVTGTTISSTWANALTADIATGLSTCVTKDGQTTTTAIVPFAAGINVTATASSFYIVTTETLTLTGCTTSPTYTVYITKLGNQVTLNFRGMVTTGTSNATTKTLTGLSSAYRPASLTYAMGIASDNGGAQVAARFEIAASGVITMSADTNASSWTASGTMIFVPLNITYTTA